MDNENIYDAAYSETQVIEENETKHTYSITIKMMNMHL